MDKFQIVSKNAEDTIAIAKKIAPCFQLGDVILLDGDLGTGKTQFVKGFTSELGSPDLVTSPTFTIAQFYSIENGALLHIDTYRLSGMEEFRDTGLFDFFPQAITLIEWGSKIIDELDNYILFHFEHVPSNEEYRKITCTYYGDKCAEQFKLLSQKLADFS